MEVPNIAYGGKEKWIRHIQYLMQIASSVYSPFERKEFDLF